MNIKELYEFGRQALSDPYFKNPALEASVLLHKATGIDKVAFYRDKDRIVTNEQVNEYKELLERRLSNEPIAYILGKKEFYSREFKVDKNVLIPRPETELLVEQAIKLLDGIRNPFILDIGTGSGCIAVSIIAEVAGCICIATDISQRALNKAQQNAALFGTRPHFVRGSLLEFIGDDKFDIVVSNPPYVKEQDFSNLDSGVKNYEPKTALVSQDDGLALISRIITESRRVLKSGGWCILEIGYGQAESVIEKFELNGYKETRVFKDLSGIDRVVRAKWTK